MKIAIDVNELCRSSYYGVKIYTYNVLKELAALDKINEYILYSEKDFLTAEADAIVAGNSNFVHKIIGWNKPFWTYTRLPYEIWKDKPDVLFMPIQTVPFLEHNIGLNNGTKTKSSNNLLNFVLKPKWLKIATVIHDTAFLKFPQHFKFWNRFALTNNTKRALHLSEAIITPSKATKNDILANYGADPQNIEIINNGFDAGLFFSRPQSRSDRQLLTERYKLTKPYIIFIGVIQPRKNIGFLVKAFRELILKNKQDLEMVIVGNRGWMSEKIYKEIRECGFFNRIRLVENVSNRDLAILLRGAQVLVLPSLYEGFGLPIVEAMACGAPVVLSNVSSLPEIAEKAGVYIDPNNYHTIAEAVFKILTDKVWQEELRRKSLAQAKKFSWRFTAEKIYKLLINFKQ